MVMDWYTRMVVVEVRAVQKTIHTCGAMETAIQHHKALEVALAFHRVVITMVMRVRLLARVRRGL